MNKMNVLEKNDKMKPVENVKRPKFLWKDLLIAKFPIVE